MQETMQNLEIYGYILLFFSSFGGSFLGIVAAGVLSSLGKLDLVLSILIASSGNICGNFLLIYFAKYQKRFFKSKKYTRKIALVYLWLKRYGVLLIFANKYLYGFKTILPLVIGISKYPLKKFFVWNLFSSLLWGSIMGSVGFFASNLAIKIFEEWKRYPYLFPVVFVSVILVLGFFIYFKSNKSPISTHKNRPIKLVE